MVLRQNQKDRIVSWAANSLMLIGFTSMLLCGLWAWAAQPVVQVSAVSGECVRVEAIGGGYSCSNLPEKYDLVWVK